MNTLSQVPEKMQQILTTTADNAARNTGFVKRNRKLIGQFSFRFSAGIYHDSYKISKNYRSGRVRETQHTVCTISLIDQLIILKNK